DILLGDEVHPVTKWRDQADTAGAIDACQHVTRIALVDVPKGDPIEVGKGAVDVAGQFLRRGADALVAAHRRARRWRQPAERDPATPFRGFDKERRVARDATL